MLLMLMLLFAFTLFVQSVPFSINKKADSQCVCVPLQLCRDNDVIVNGQGLLDIRFPRGTCENYFDVCCENPLKELEPLKQIQFFCGQRSGLNIRITDNSDKAQYGELPWTVIVLYKDLKAMDRNLYKCGGSLIHEQVVMTAAHCVSKMESTRLIVRAGELNTLTQEEPLPHQDRIVEEIVTHPQYHSTSLKNDIALLFLTKPMNLAENVNIICLPPPGLNMDEIKCVASGWGKNAFKKGTHSSILKKIELPIVERNKCLTALRKTRLGSFYNLHQSFICAGGEEGKDTCKGDGGSPLVCPIPGENDRFLQLGIVAWGIGCGEETPGVYVNVALYRDWIDKQLIEKNLDVNVYKYE